MTVITAGQVSYVYVASVCAGGRNAVTQGAKYTSEEVFKPL
jgi:hypothetical protein